MAADRNRDGDRHPDAMGKAMTHMAVVFAELERDFIRNYSVNTVRETDHGGPRPTKINARRCVDSCCAGAEGRQDAVRNARI